MRSPRGLKGLEDIEHVLNSSTLVRSLPLLPDWAVGGSNSSKFCLIRLLLGPHVQ